MSKLVAVLVALAAIIAGVTVAAVYHDHQHGGHAAAGPPVVTAPTVKVPTVTKVSPGKGEPPVTVKAPPAAIKDALDSDHQGLRDQTPPGVPDAELNAAQDQQEAFAQKDQLAITQPAASPEQRGCRSRFVQDFSSRGGVKPRLFVVHYTVSSNRPGWSDVDAIVNLFNTWSYQASSNYVFDYEGNCAYIVREADKAWTQATFNPVSVSVEVIANGSEGYFVQGAALKKLGTIISDSAKRWGIPLQRGAVSGCTVTRPGIVMHKDLGACGGGHFDISPYSLTPIIHAAQAARKGASSASAKSKCKPAKSVNVKEHYCGYSRLSKGERANVTKLLTARRWANRHHGFDRKHAKAASDARHGLERSIKWLDKHHGDHHGARAHTLKRVVRAKWERKR